MSNPMAKLITFECQDLILEGMMDLKSPLNAAIIAHPHPLYGGNMHNEVVDIISKVYLNKGWSTLRFNFRGTGNSQGKFDNGIGEQEDVDAAITHLTVSGFQEIELAGYSYGAYILAFRASRHSHPQNVMRYIAPPVAFMDFKPINQVKGLKQVVVGTRDEFAPANRVETLAHQWNPNVEINVIENADHFFGNHLNLLQKVLEASIPTISVITDNPDK